MIVGEIIKLGFLLAYLVSIWIATWVIWGADNNNNPNLVRNTNKYIFFASFCGVVGVTVAIILLVYGPGSKAKAGKGAVASLANILS